MCVQCISTPNQHVVPKLWFGVQIQGKHGQGQSLILIAILTLLPQMDVKWSYRGEIFIKSLDNVFQCFKSEQLFCRNRLQTFCSVFLFLFFFCNVLNFDVA